MIKLLTHGQTEKVHEMVGIHFIRMDQTFIHTDFLLVLLLLMETKCC
jgi:hypothetical protein